MRGKVKMNEIPWLEIRITPAYAGKRSLGTQSSLYQEDHPRLCGEKVIIRAGFGVNGRITPAYAGKRFWYILF